MGLTYCQFKNRQAQKSTSGYSKKAGLNQQTRIVFVTVGHASTWRPHPSFKPTYL